MELFGNNPTANLLPCDGTANYFGRILGLEPASQYHDALLSRVPWKHDEAVIFGKHIVTARKVAWYGDANYSYAYSGTTKQALVWNEELLALKLNGNAWGMLLVLASGGLLIISTLGAELFTARLSFLFTLIGVLWTLGGTLLLRKLAFPLFLLFFMVPIPAVIYNRITFPLQILASQLADGALTVLFVIGLYAISVGIMLIISSLQTRKPNSSFIPHTA